MPPPKNPPHRQQLGKKGEDYATSYLQQKGYTILDRNFKARYGEIDIIAIAPVILSEAKNLSNIFNKDRRSTHTLVFIEVKSRIGREFGLPEESVTPRKLREVIQTAQYYMISHPNLPKAMRIDVIAIEYDENEKIITFKHLENVTQ